MSTTRDRVTLDVCGSCGATRWVPAGEAQDFGLRRCSGCGTLRFEAVDPPEVVYRDGYHTGEIEYGWDYTAFDEAGYEEAVAHARLDWIDRHLDPGRVVDVGGGLGSFAAAAASRGWDATLLEPVPRAVEEARRRHGVRAVVGGADDLARRGETYDLVAFIHCIEHIPEARETLGAAREAIGPAGLLFVEVPNHGSLARRLLGERWLGWQAGEHVYVFDRRALLGLLDRAGYEVVAERSFVPGWAGLAPDAYAHFLGVAPLLRRAVRVKRGLGRRGRSGPPSAGPASAPRPIAEARGLRKALFGRGFDGLAHLEETLGLGTNLQVLARPRR